MYDEIIFAEDKEEEVFNDLHKWKVLIVDDEPQIHAVTKLALSDFSFLEKRIEFISAYSGEEAKQIFLSQSDIAVVLLDVVMETDDAGLLVADFIRNEANNNFTRIILRTGQPGQAPERDVITNYDINDYKSKTELTSQKLFTVVIAALRSYRDIMVIDESRRGLEKIIAASADLFSVRSLEQFIEGIMQQLASLLGGTQNAIYLSPVVVGPIPIEQHNPSQLYVLTGQGEYQNMEGLPLEQVVDGNKLLSCQKALDEKRLVYEDEYLVAYCNSKTKRGSLLYLSGIPKKLTAADKHLIEIFSQNVQVAFENVLLTKDIEDTQQELIERIGQALDSHFSEGKHMQRLVAICSLLGREYGLDEEQLKALRLAVPLHDIGKISVPHNILHKSDELEPTEAAILREHTKFAYELLRHSSRPLIKTVALLARDHHEFWNGQGFPQGLAGEDIHIYCRITAIADAYDNLRTKRNGKDEMSVASAIEAIEREKGQQFEPKLVEILQTNIDKIEQILLNNSDYKPRKYKMYAIVKHIHLTAIALSLALFLLRFIWTLRQSAMLQTKWVKILPHVVDTLLLLSAATLCVLIGQYPFVTAWVSEKFLALIMYIFMVVLTLKIAKTGFMRAVGFIGALSWLAFAGFVAVTKQALIF